MSILIELALLIPNWCIKTEPEFVHIKSVLLTLQVHKLLKPLVIGSGVVEVLHFNVWSVSLNDETPDYSENILSKNGQMCQNYVFLCAISKNHKNQLNLDLSFTHLM